MFGDGNVRVDWEEGFEIQITSPRPQAPPAPGSLSPIIVNCGASMFVAWPAQGSTHKVPPTNPNRQ